MPLEVIPLEAGKSDQETAADLRRRVRAALEPVAELCREAQSHGMRITFSIGADAFGRSVVQDISVVKPL